MSQLDFADLLFYVGVELSTIRWLRALKVMDMPIIA